MNPKGRDSAVRHRHELLIRRHRCNWPNRTVFLQLDFGMENEGPRPRGFADKCVWRNFTGSNSVFGSFSRATAHRLMFGHVGVTFEGFYMFFWTNRKIECRSHENPLSVVAVISTNLRISPPCSQPQLRDSTSCGLETPVYLSHRLHCYTEGK